MRPGISTAIVLAMVLGGVAMAAPAVTAAPVPGAVGPRFQVDMPVHDHCFTILDPAGADPLTVVHRRGGTLMARVVVASEPGARPCVGTLRPGDSIRIRQSGQLRRSLEVPDLRLRIDLLANRITGRVPASAPSASLFGSLEIAGLEVAQFDATPEVATDGTFVHDMDGTFRMTAGDPVALRWQSTDGDLFGIWESTPSVMVMAGRSRVEVTARHGTRFTVTLRDGDRTRATFARQLPPYEVWTAGDLRRNGVAIRVVAGNRVLHAHRSGAMLTVLPKAITLEATDGGSVATTCFPGTIAVIDVNDQRRFTQPVGPTGLVAADDLTDGDGDLASGDWVLVGCENGKGGAQRRLATVP